MEDTNNTVVVTDETNLLRRKLACLQEETKHLKEEMAVIEHKCSYYQDMLYIMTDANIDKDEIISVLKKRIKKNSNEYHASILRNQIGCTLLGFVITSLILIVVLMTVKGWW